MSESIEGIEATFGERVIRESATQSPASRETGGEGRADRAESALQYAARCLERAWECSGRACEREVKKGFRALQTACQEFVGGQLLSGALGRPESRLVLDDLPELLIARPTVRAISALITDVATLLSGDGLTEQELETRFEPGELRDCIEWYLDIERCWQLEMGGLSAMRAQG